MFRPETDRVNESAENQKDIGPSDVRTDSTGFLGTVDQRLGPRMQLIPALGHSWISFRDLLQEHKILVLQLFCRHSQELQQRTRGISGFTQLSRDGAERGEMTADDHGDQFLLRGEVSKDGPLRHARTASDIRDRGIHSPLGELLLCGSEEQFSVARRV
ncbi:hypothetical protein GCM10027590_13760 [Nocardiopsis nanhaiensis]